jgi:predicted DNA-binding protein
MYADPKRVREHVYKVRLSDYERAKLDALVKKTGGQPSAILRQLVLEQIEVALSEITAEATNNEGP